MPIGRAPYRRIPHRVQAAPECKKTKKKKRRNINKEENVKETRAWSIFQLVPWQVYSRHKILSLAS